MPLWAFSLRTLVCRHSFKYSSWSPKHNTQWLRLRQPRRSYTTALQPSPQDENVITLPALLAESSNEPQRLSLSLSEDSSELSTNQRKNASPKRRERRKRAPKPPRPSEITLVRYRQPQGKSLSRTMFAIRERKRALRLPPVPVTKIPSPIRNSLPAWEDEFARIHSYYLKNHPKPQYPILDVRVLGWVEHVLERLDAGQQVFTRNDLTDSTLEAFRGPIWVWQQVALWLLAYDKRNMIRFLVATHVDPYVPAGLVATSLTHLTAYFDRFKDGVHMQRLAEAFCVLADRTGKDALSLHSPVIGRMVPYCSEEQVHHMFAAASAHKVQLPPDTWLNLSRYFANNHHFENVLDCLLQAHKTGAELNAYPFRSTCSVVLRRSSVEPDGLRVCLRVVSTLVDIGVQLDGPIFDIIMLNAIDAGDLKTAFDVYYTLVDRGLQRRESTFRVLLQGCKMNIDDANMLNEVIRDAIANVNVRKSEIVANQILHCLALHHSKHHPKTVLNTLTEAYAQLFDLRPLQKLHLPMPNIEHSHPNPDELMPPSRHALAFTIGASIQQTLLQNRNPKELLPLYERWRSLVESGEPYLADLAITDHVSNIFLMAFIRTPKTLLQAARVVRDMQRPLPPSSGVQQIKPTVQTWSIFLHGFTRHGQMKLAEQILNYMRSKSIDPNLVTWNTLMTGYARLQDVEGTVNTLRQAEEEGMVWDAWTHGGLRRLKERWVVEEEFGKEKLRERLDFTEELKRGLGERVLGGGGEVQVVGGSSADLAETGEVEGFGDSPAELDERGSYKPLGG